MKRRFSSLNSDGQDILERRPYKSQLLGLVCAIRELKKQANLCNDRARTSIDAQNMLVKMKPRISLLRSKLDDLASAVNTAQAQWCKGSVELASMMVKIKYEISLMMRTIDELHITEGKPTAVRDDQKHRVPQSKRTPIIWNIPHDLLRKLSEYLNEDELFEARGVHRIFYRAYYELRLGVETHTAFNFRRALKLAQMGRVFKNVEYFYWVIHGEHCFKIPECLNPIHFPALHFLEIDGGNNSVNPENSNMRSEDENKQSQSEDRPSHPNIRTVQIVDCRAELLTDERFPNLTELICVGEVDLQGCRLSRLQLIKFYHFPKDFEAISRGTFPSLEKIVFDRNIGLIRNVEERLREEGVSVIFLK